MIMHNARDIEENNVTDRQRQVWACLDGVSDPELDESVTELNFITNADVDPQNRVHIGFRLPTYWCAANFSFLMADDMRRAVSELDWVEGVTVVIGEHMYADKINNGLAKGLSFQETFGDEANGDLDELRQSFLVKAFQRRQAALIKHLRDAGHAPEMLVELTLGELEALPTVEEGQTLVRRYIERRGVVGPVRPDAHAFITAEGARLKSDAIGSYLTGLRRIGVNAEFNSALCRGLLSVRFDLETPFVPSWKTAQASEAQTSV
jgi:metal-sulfur cluster biosynthetic enzyme